MRTGRRGIAWGLIAVLVGCTTISDDGRAADDTVDTDVQTPEDDFDATSDTEESANGTPPESTTDDAFEAADFAPTFAARPDCFGIEPRGIEADEVRCGTVEVPLRYDDAGFAADRATPDTSRDPDATIDIAVTVFAGSSPDDAEDPLMILGGGPGEVMIRTLLTEPAVRDLFEVGADLIVIDQRGVGSSTPALDCPEISGFGLQDTVGPDTSRALDAVRACRARLIDDGVDLDAFNHVANARDVELVREALGHDRLNIRGTSYGTQIALLTAGLHPQSVRSLTLSSPLDPRVNWVESLGSGLDQALSRLIEVCELDENCAGQIGDLRAALDQTVQRLEAQPQQVTVQPPGGEQVTVTYGPAAFLNGVLAMFYLPDGVSVLPALIDAARDGRLEPLARIIATIEQALEQGMATGMHLSMMCSGEAASAVAADRPDGIDSALIRDHWYPVALLGGEPTEELCDIWDVELAYSPGDIALPTRVPTLIVTGAFDHVTPPQYGEDLDEALATSHLIQVADAGHGPLESLGSCGRRIVSDFLAEPIEPPDDRCATDARLRLLTELPRLPGLSAG